MPPPTHQVSLNLSGSLPFFLFLQQPFAQPPYCYSHPQDLGKPSTLARDTPEHLQRDPLAKALAQQGYMPLRCRNLLFDMMPCQFSGSSATALEQPREQTGNRGWL